MCVTNVPLCYKRSLLCKSARGKLQKCPRKCYKSALESVTKVPLRYKSALGSVTKVP